MMNRSVQIIDYGMGNLWSVMSAFAYLGAAASVISSPEDIRKAECLILPGVGSYARAMQALKLSAQDEAIKEAALKGTKILGICLGMQIFTEVGTEDGETKGLGIVPGRVDRFSFEEVANNKIPHIGFDQVNSGGCEILFENIPQYSDFYFVHSYRMIQIPGDIKVAYCSYEKDFVAAFEKDNIFATQFHPEKSQKNGSMLLRNFLEYKC